MTDVVYCALQCCLGAKVTVSNFAAADLCCHFVSETVMFCKFHTCWNAIV